MTNHTTTLPVRLRVGDDHYEWEIGDVSTVPGGNINFPALADMLIATGQYMHQVIAGAQPAQTLPPELRVDQETP